jgi:hypothetical protein
MPLRFDGKTGLANVEFCSHDLWPSIALDTAKSAASSWFTAKTGCVLLSHRFASRPKPKAEKFRPNAQQIK